MARYHVRWRAPLEQPKPPGKFLTYLQRALSVFAPWEDIYPPVDETALERTRQVAQALGITALNNSGIVYFNFKDCTSTHGIPATSSELAELVTEHDASSTGTNPFFAASILLARQPILDMTYPAPRAEFAVFNYDEGRRVIKLYPGGHDFLPRPNRSHDEASAATVRWLMPEAVNADPTILNTPDVVVGYFESDGSFQPGPHPVRYDRETAGLFHALYLVSMGGPDSAHTKIEAGIVSDM